jgi:cold shock CspA family protein
VILHDGYKRGDSDEKTQGRLSRLVDEISRYALAKRSEFLCSTLIGELKKHEDSVVRALVEESPSVVEVMKTWPNVWRAAFEQRPVVPLPSVSENISNQDVGVPGTVVRMRETFGFIRDEVGLEFFFHNTNVRPASAFDLITVGTKVVFQEGRSAKGPTAAWVKLQMP